MSKRKKLDIGIRYYNENGVEVTKRVAEGRTMVIPGIGYNEEKAATDLAASKCTTVYPVYIKEVRRLKHYGYAVPA